MSFTVDHHDDDDTSSINSQSGQQASVFDNPKHKCQFRLVEKVCRECMWVTNNNHTSDPEYWRCFSRCPEVDPQWDAEHCDWDKDEEEWIYSGGAHWQESGCEPTHANLHGIHVSLMDENDAKRYPCQVCLLGDSAVLNQEGRVLALYPAVRYTYWPPQNTIAVEWDIREDVPIVGWDIEKDDPIREVHKESPEYVAALENEARKRAEGAQQG